MCMHGLTSVSADAIGVTRAAGTGDGAREPGGGGARGSYSGAVWDLAAGGVLGVNHTGASQGDAGVGWASVGEGAHVLTHLSM